MNKITFNDMQNRLSLVVSNGGIHSKKSKSASEFQEHILFSNIDKVPVSNEVAYLDGADAMRNQLIEMLIHSISGLSSMDAVCVAIAVDNCDLFSEERAYSGLVDRLNKNDLDVYNTLFGLNVTVADYEQVLRLLKYRSCLYGFGCTSSAEFHQQLFAFEPQPFVYEYEKLHKAYVERDALANMHRTFLPSGPLDPRYFTLGRML